MATERANITVLDRVLDYLIEVDGNRVDVTKEELIDICFVPKRLTLEAIDWLVKVGLIKEYKGNYFLVERLSERARSIKLANNNELKQIEKDKINCDG